MKIEYPKKLVPLNLQPNVDIKNSGDDSPEVKHDDHLYLLDQLQKKVGIDGDSNQSSLDYRIAQLEKDIDDQQTLIENLSGITIDKGYLHISSAGINTVPLNITAPNNDYLPVLVFINDNGNSIIAIPQIAPSTTESRTTTQFQVDCPDTGYLYWEIRL